MIKFILKQDKEDMSQTFEEVKNGQFFLTSNKSLWQKINSTSAVKIAYGDGVPAGELGEFYTNEPMYKILPEVSRIILEI